MRRVPVEVEFGDPLKAFRGDGEQPVVARRDGDVGRQVDGRRHNKAIVIIGVFADEVDAPRRAKNARLGAEGNPEFLSEFQRIIHGAIIR